MIDETLLLRVDCFDSIRSDRSVEKVDFELERAGG